jgi:hypothetical protein
LRVMHIVPYRLQDVIDKGEVVDRYFNPGNVASEITFVSWREIPRDLSALQRMCGNAKVNVLGQQNWDAAGAAFVALPGIGRRWLCDMKFEPESYDLIRANTRSDGWIAVGQKTPSLISVHSDRQRALEEVPWYARPVFWIEAHRQERICKLATKTIVVSQGLCHIAPHAEWIPNVVAQPSEQQETVNRVLCVSREMSGKGFEPMRAACVRAGVEFHAVGEQFQESNDRIMELMATSRVVALRNHYPGVPKTVQEALLSKVPVVMNRQAAIYGPELKASSIFFCEDTVEGYASAIQTAWGTTPVEGDPTWGRKMWDPEATEARWAQAYREAAS